MICIQRPAILVLSIGCLCAATVDDASAQHAQPLRLLSFNIHHCEGVDGETDIGRIAEIIRDADPDLVALQEVDVNTARTGNVDQAAELARLCEMEYRFGKTLDHQGGEYGNAVLSKLPIVDTENIRLPRHEGEPRALLMVRVNVSAGRPLLFIATHFDNAKDQARLAAAAKLQQVVQEQRVPTAVAGDLNCTPDSAPFSRLTPVLQLPDDRLHPTVPVGDPARQIDFVLFDRSSGWEFLQTEVIDPRGASDHRPILSVVQLR